MEESLQDFNREDRILADAGYRELFHHGADAIPLLLDNVGRTTIFRGRLYQDSKYSFVRHDPSQGLVALYLVEAIRLNRMAPHRTPLLLDASGDSPPDAFARAVTAYRQWWQSLSDRSTAGVRAAPDPLAGTGLRWF